VWSFGKLSHNYNLKVRAKVREPLIKMPPGGLVRFKECSGCDVLKGKREGVLDFPPSLEKGLGLLFWNQETCPLNKLGVGKRIGLLEPAQENFESVLCAKKYEVIEKMVSNMGEFFFFKARAVEFRNLFWRENGRENPSR
tara:strand:- start:456 stop:875 length:420 start_codon:yes stop_codon:yes gene_type:complete